MNRNPMIPKFDPTQPIVVSRGFRSGKNQLKANDPFDTTGIDLGTLNELAGAGYIRNGKPIERDRGVADARRKAEADQKAAEKLAKDAADKVEQARHKETKERAKRVAAALRPAAG